MKIIDLSNCSLCYILALICLAMIVDFLSGMWVAKRQKCFESGKGINGILRKLASIFLLLFFWPVAHLIPAGAGVALLYTFYLGYLLMEIQSILENYRALGIDIKAFQWFLDQFKTHFKK
ncbi:phage holin family protein [Enterococcus canis]|nr:phage holin family protein [Enterococcus canis]